MINHFQYNSGNYNDFLGESIYDIKKQLTESEKEIKKLNLKIQELKFEMEKIKENNNKSTELLNTAIKEKDEEIKQMKKGNSNSTNKYAREDFISINFQHPKYNYSLPCLKNDIFAEVEEKFYQEYPELRETNNIILYNGFPILRFKTVAENKIKNGFPVLLIIPE